MVEPITPEMESYEARLAEWSHELVPYIVDELGLQLETRADLNKLLKDVTVEVPKGAESKVAARFVNGVHGTQEFYLEFNPRGVWPLTQAERRAKGVQILVERINYVFKLSYSENN
ncbi:hypothetical protein SPFM12_00206 [Salmonella phage SPFM12]|nr:hypothetical protein SPFM12_00206 [Salmonella phage SPFM12]